MCHLVATRDIAKLYQVETKRINAAVKNNPDKSKNPTKPKERKLKKQPNQK